MRALSSVETAFASTASQEHIIPGLLAQLVEHLVYTEGVRGSSPLGPTNLYCLVRQDCQVGQGACLKNTLSGFDSWSWHK